jgi:hypothetical protein
MSKSPPIWAITGAAGRIGTVLRKGLADDVAEMRCLDIRPVEALDNHEVAYQIDLSDLNATELAFRGCAGVVHFGGYPSEADFHDLARVNIEGRSWVEGPAGATRSGGPRGGSVIASGRQGHSQRRRAGPAWRSSARAVTRSKLEPGSGRIGLDPERTFVVHHRGVCRSRQGGKFLAFSRRQ